MNRANAIPYIFLFALICLISCDKDDEEETEEFDGYITFYTKSLENGCGNIMLSLDENDIGPLSGNTATDPECQASNGSGIITVGVDIGAHDYEASDQCNTIWTGTIIINRGDCKTKELSR